MLKNSRMGGLSRKQKEYLALALIMALAAVLRFYQLDAIPVGLSGDEGADGYGAKRILSGKELPIFVTADFGEEPMHTYLVALSFALWSPSLWAIRFVSAVVGLLGILVIFCLAKELFPGDGRSRSWIALLSAFLAATSYWHIIYSRAGLEVITLPLFSSALLYFLWRGLHSDRRWPFAAAGLLLGASLYAYRGARFLPILLALFFGGWLLISREFRRRQFLNLVLVASLAALVCLPLAAYAVVHPDVFFGREMHVSIFNPEWGQGSPVQAFSTALVKTMGMFNFQGDPEFDRNPGRRPVLDPLSSICFAIGLGVALWRWRQANYLFTVVWFLIMALPGAFTAEVLPHFHRGIGALPPLCLLSAIGIVAFGQMWKKRMSWRGNRAFLWAAISLVLISISLLSYRDYFGPWQRRLAKGEIIGSSYMEAASIMNSTRIPNGAWILPASSLRPRNLPFYEVDFLYEGPEPQYTFNVDEETAPGELTEICQGHQTAAVITWKQFTLEKAYESLNSDPKGLLDFLLRKYGRRVGEESFDSFDLLTYELPESPAFTIAESFDAIDADFGENLRLVALALGGSSQNATSSPQDVEGKMLPSGKEAWVVLQWQATATPDRDYKVAVYLLGAKERLIGQVDKLLLSNHLQPTSGWAAGQVEMDYYTLPSPPGTPPGDYEIAVAVYDPQTMERLPVRGHGEGVTGTSLVVGKLQVVKPLLPPQVQPTEEVAAAEGDLAPGLRLLGYDFPVRVFGPGEKLSLALYWQALEEMRQDYVVSLRLQDSHGTVKAEQEGRPVDETYPTTSWDKGEIVKEWRDLPLPADTPRGFYELSVGISDREHSYRETYLGQVEVRGRNRQFEIPPIQHPSRARFGEGVQFLGYDLNTDKVKPGERLRLTLYWQALEEMETSYTVFTHLLDPANRIWGQTDSIPGGGTLPTTSWIEGEVITDEYEIITSPDAPAGEYLLEVGMYDASTGERLSTYDSEGELQGDRVLLGPVTVLASTS